MCNLLQFPSRWRASAVICMSIAEASSIIQLQIQLGVVASPTTYLLLSMSVTLFSPLLLQIQRQRSKDYAIFQEATLLIRLLTHTFHALSRCAYIQEGAAQLWSFIRDTRRSSRCGQRYLHLDQIRSLSWH